VVLEKSSLKRLATLYTFHATASNVRLCEICPKDLDGQSYAIKKVMKIGDKLLNKLSMTYSRAEADMSTL
jgi:hypothetical protein